MRVLLTDIVMPGMNGFELANRARLLRPDLCIIYMMGYSPDALPEVEQLHGTVLLKPCPVERLVH